LIRRQAIVSFHIVAGVAVEHVNVRRCLCGKVQGIARDAVTSGNEHHPLGGWVIAQHDASAERRW
jgi:hypothetical protein